jgi:dTDP-glucose 4,6-dehydratase
MEMAGPHRVLITGAGGFIGSHVTELLLREGLRVGALTRYNGRGDIGHLRYIPESLTASLEVRLGGSRGSSGIHKRPVFKMV